MIINFKNFILYIQRKINDFFYLYRYFTKCYINDIVIFFKIAKKYFKYLRIIFRLFIQLKITLELKKSYFKYLFMIFLNKKIDEFDLIIIEKKIIIIKKIRFSKILKTLKIYINMIN